MTLPMEPVGPEFYSNVSLAGYLGAGFVSYLGMLLNIHFYAQDMNLICPKLSMHLQPKYLERDQKC